MRVSLVPWELIWLASLIVFGLSLLGVVIGWLRHRKGGWPTSPLLYLSLLLVIAIPAGLKLTGYRFDLDTKHDEITRPEHALPDLITRQYGPTTIQAMYDAAVRAIQQSKTYGQPWRITYAGVDAYEAARIDVLVPVFFFTDTMSISIVTNRRRRCRVRLGSHRPPGAAARR
jgi:hypothetical protein